MPNVERRVPDWAAREREQDQTWIQQNLDVFWHMASQGFQVIGRGAIFVDVASRPMGKQNLFAYFNTADVADRTPMRLLGDYYLDTLFYMTAKYAVQTEGNHRILNPGVYTATGTWADRVFFPSGVFFSHYA